MITVNLKGGLGNQMFQYACGRALAIRNSDDLQLTRSEKISDVDRPFSLVNFNIKAGVMPFQQVDWWQRFKSLIEQKILRRFYVGFDPRILNMHGDIYLDGYFQSEKYFVDFAETIRGDLRLKKGLAGAAAIAAAQIEGDGYAVALHCRRGDYVTHHDFGGIADEAYFARALAEIKKHEPDAHLYVFSDDITWCKENLSFAENETTFVSEPDMQDYEELVLMSKCQHNIISNSSFSWWGAWLNSNPNKLVITPSRWSKNHEKNWYNDIIPKTWTRI